MPRKHKKVLANRETDVHVDPAFAALVSVFAKNQDVTYGGTGFGSRALKVNGRIFAMMSSRRQVVVKLPKNRVDDLVRRGQGEYFDSGNGRPMKEWLVLRGTTTSWLEFARAAYRFVRNG